MVKKKLFAALAVGTFAVTAIAGVALNNSNTFSAVAEDVKYSVTLDAKNASTLTATSNAINGNTFQFVAEGLTSAEGKLGTLAADGFITLAEGHALNNLDNIVIDVEGGDTSNLKVLTAFENGEWVRSNLLFNEGKLDLSKERANFVKIAATAETVINSVQFTYAYDGGSCATGALAPKGYSETNWFVIGNHTESEWSFGDVTRTTLHKENNNLEFVEHKATFVGMKGTEFKIVSGESWENYTEISGVNLEFDSKYFEVLEGGNVAVVKENNEEKGQEEVGTLHYIDVYVKAYADKTTAYVALGDALTNPNDKDDETAVKDVYFVKPADFVAPIYAHYYDDYGNSTEWPGIEMTLVEGDLYKVTYNTTYYNHLIFVDSSEPQNEIKTTSPTGDNIKYVDGVWVELTGEVETQTVYCYADYAQVNAYVWNKTTDDKFSAWPGTAMTKLAGKENYWTIDIPVGLYDMIIFNDGSLQTADLELPAADAEENCFYTDVNKWGTLETKPEADPVEHVLYLKPNSNWKSDNARFAAYFFGAGEKWKSMTDENGDGTYEVVVPAGFPKIIFCRMNPSASANNWNNKWNQTGNLIIPTDGKNCYTVKEGTWDKGGGTWSTL